MLRELVSQAASRLTYVQRRAERTEDTVDDVAAGAGERINDMIGTMMGVSENGGAGEVGASMVA